MGSMTEHFLGRFLEVINKESKTTEKEYFRQSIINLIKTANFNVSPEDESASYITYRIDFEDFYVTNFGLTENDVNEILEEFKDEGYRCAIHNSSSTNNTFLPDTYRIHFQTFVTVKKIPDAIHNPANINYITLGQCEILSSQIKGEY